MWYFLSVAVFKGELLAVKVQSFFNFFQQQNAVLQKKINEKAQTDKFTVFTMGCQLRADKNRKTGQTKT